MITTYLNGGMANQMFQYGCGLAAAKKLGTTLKLNTSSFASDPMREYSLHLWAGITEEVDSNPPTGNMVREEGLPYNPVVASKFVDGCTLWGYWQCPKYLEGVESELLARFVPKQPLTDQDKEARNRILAAGDSSVFLTIRRTDYANSDYHGVLPSSYYEKALEIIRASVYDPQIFIFSDEPEWCKENIRFPYNMVAGNYDRTVKGHIGREDAELYLMSLCRHAVMANSSYSWFGAWLGADKTGGIIVRPEKWFLGAHEDSSQICPSHWASL
jgi:hypothetical protein